MSRIKRTQEEDAAMEQIERHYAKAEALMAGMAHMLGNRTYGTEATLDAAQGLLTQAKLEMDAIHQKRPAPRMDFKPKRRPRPKRS